MQSRFRRIKNKLKLPAQAARDFTILLSKNIQEEKSKRVIAKRTSNTVALSCPPLADQFQSLSKRHSIIGGGYISWERLQTVPLRTVPETFKKASFKRSGRRAPCLYSPAGNSVLYYPSSLRSGDNSSSQCQFTTFLKLGTHHTTYHYILCHAEYGKIRQYRAMLKLERKNI
jgi:hypothetical protein